MKYFQSSDRKLAAKCAKFDALLCAEEDAEREYMDLLKEMPPVLERTPAQQRMVDAALSEKQRTFYARLHWSM